jgi:transcriptional regulator with XRE-family HTH domain
MMTYYYINVIRTELTSENDRTSGPVSALTLSELRKRLGRSQAEVASGIGTTQSGVSRLERQPDIRVSTLDGYVSALGGRLHLLVEHDAGRTEIVVPSLGQYRTEEQRREYRVIWQDPRTRGLVHVGWLEFTGNEFVFSYTEEAKSNPSFEPFPPFPLFDETYRCVDLFPFFSVRLTSTADPRFEAIIDALGLTREHATPAELLARSPTESPHDTIQVVPEPTELPDGTLLRTFLVSGVRHADEQHPQGVSQLVNKLRPGTKLQLVPEPGNSKNPRALQLAAEGHVIGWVPDYLVDEIHMYLKSNRKLSFAVDRANGPDAPWHLRLLCRLTVTPPSSDAATI